MEKQGWQRIAEVSEKRIAPRVFYTNAPAVVARFGVVRGGVRRAAPRRQTDAKKEPDWHLQLRLARAIFIQARTIMKVFVLHPITESFRTKTGGWSVRLENAIGFETSSEALE